MTATTAYDIASKFADNGNQQRGIIIELTNMFKPGSIKNETRAHGVDWISIHCEKEWIYFGYNNTILITNIRFVL